ncbi:ATP synthase F1 subunit epsilon [Novisyntrophococcus fermenticellae]|uniref:ATP synthase F1 subunit epsilon n=1 Tax=Novisyntrophococcus fermenticellae TaxID=2068655 RepID=UPI001E3FA413|nr:ATP synthase F1 subunit epsilon [Novisyntrophococcus fermenticellae]
MAEKERNSFYLKILAADKVFCQGKAYNVILPAVDGQFSILAHHADTMVAVQTGELRYHTLDGVWHTAVVGNGFAQVINNRMTVLVDFAERPEEINILRAKEARERAEEQLRQKQSIQEYYHTQASLARAMTRLRVTGTNNINRK